MSKKVLDMMKEHDVKFVDFRFTDPRGKWQHTAKTASAVDESVFVDGVMFDGSSISGWKAINESDMILMPDPDSAVLDPFSAQTTLILSCDVVEPSTGQPYARCPRSTAKRAEAFMKSSGVGDTAVFGPELEFFVFDDVKFKVSMEHNFFKIYSSEGPYATGDDFEGGNMGHRPGVKGGYFPVQPVDSMNDLRAEMCSVLTEMGLIVEIHHHEVAPSQNEIGFRFDTLVKTADNVQKYKYTLHNVAHSYGKTLTFMPKPLYGDNGSGMHTHQSIWKDGKPLFAGSGYADLSETALFYIGGIIKHAKALNAFTNAS
ncbi:MAG: glutamine synthetase beta-grasp domain-containing protein, partial [Rhodospirillales bacterium]